MNAGPGQSNAKAGPLEVFLKLFADVRGGEGRNVLLLTLNIFIILTAYYIIKPVREALILATPRGDEWKSYSAAGQVLLSIGAVRLYASLAQRYAPRKLIRNVTLFFGSNLILFFFFIRFFGLGSVGLGIGFYLWVGIFNLMLPAQFWSFANDTYTPEQGKRLFAIVAFGASGGAVLGSDIAGRLLEALGLAQLLLASCALLILGLLVTAGVRSTERSKETGTLEVEATFSKDGAFDLVWHNRYLLLIAFLLLMTNWVNTTGEFILSRTVKENAELLAREQGLTGVALTDYVGSSVGLFYAKFYYVVNIVGVLLQLFLVSRILKYLGIRIALMILPLIALGGYTLMALSAVPALALVRWSKTAENATDYSLQNTVRQALFLPTSREEKYKAKQAIDTFFVRAGDVLSAGMVFVGANLLHLQTRGYAAMAVLLVVVWLLLAISVGRRHRALASDAG